MRSVDVKLVWPSLALWRSESVRLASVRLVLTRSVCTSRAPARSAPSKSARSSVAPVRVTPARSAPVKLHPTRLAPGPGTQAFAEPTELDGRAEAEGGPAVIRIHPRRQPTVTEATPIRRLVSFFFNSPAYHREA